MQSSDKLEKLKQRVFDEIARFDYIVLNIEERRYRSDHIEKLKVLVSDCRAALKEDLKARMPYITGHLPTTIISRRLTKMRTVIKQLVDFMYAVTSRSAEVPRELYFLLDTFLENHHVIGNYVLFVEDDMAVTAFEHILQINYMDQWFPIFFKKMKDAKFYFVHVVSDFITRAASLEWPLVLHEMAHIVCYERGLYSQYYIGMSILECLQAVNDKNFPVEAQKKLYISEYIADLLTTKAVGALYGWRFLEMYGTYHDILDPGLSHPPPGKRVRKMVILVRKGLQMPKSAKFLGKELRSRTTEWQAIPRKTVHELKVDSTLNRVWKIADKFSNYALTSSRVTQSLQEGFWYGSLESEHQKIRKSQIGTETFLKETQTDFLKGIPMIVEPFVLYYLLTLDFSDTTPLTPILKPTTELEITHAQRIKELVTDTIRLYSVAKAFVSLKNA
jgi:hypothetical protein